MDVAIINLTGYVTGSASIQLEDNPNRDFGLVDVDLYGYEVPKKISKVIEESIRRTM